MNFYTGIFCGIVAVLLVKLLGAVIHWIDDVNLTIYKAKTLWKEHQK